MTYEENEIKQLNALCEEYRKKIKELEDEKEYVKQENRYWYGQANRNYEDCHNAWTEKIRKDTAKEMFQTILDYYEGVDYYGFLFEGLQAIADDKYRIRIILSENGVSVEVDDE